MFGIFYGLWCLVTSGLGSVIETVENNKTKERTYDADRQIYYDRKGRTYHAPTGKQVFGSCEGGQKWVWRDVHGNIIVDDRELGAQKAQKEGQSVIRWECKDDFKKGLNHVPGCRYKDLENGKMYVTRSWHRDYYDASLELSKRNSDYYQKIKDETPRVTFYMDLETGLLVKVKEGEYERFLEREGNNQEKLEEEKKKAEKWIENFNKRQKEIGKPDKNDGWNKFSKYWAVGYEW